MRRFTGNTSTIRALTVEASFILYPGGSNPGDPAPMEVGFSAGANAQHAVAEADALCDSVYNLLSDGVGSGDGLSVAGCHLCRLALQVANALRSSAEIVA